MQEQIERIVTTEGPIQEGLLVKRVADEWGFARVGDRIRTVVLDALPRSVHTTPDPNGPVYWPKNLDPTGFRAFRIPGEPPESKRPLEQVPCVELQNAMRHLLEEYVSLPTDDLFRECLRIFGGKQLGRAQRLILENALSRLGADLRMDNGTVYWNPA